MSRKYLNDRWCVRCNRKGPTPFLKSVLHLIPKSGSVLDLGCGNGRNSLFMLELGYKVTAVDMVGDFGIKLTLGVDPLPENKYDVILANYVLMFLNNTERYKVLKQLGGCSKIGTFLIVELYPAKDAYKCSIESIIRKLRNWVVVKKLKNRCLMYRGAIFE